MACTYIRNGACIHEAKKWKFGLTLGGCYRGVKSRNPGKKIGKSRNPGKKIGKSRNPVMIKWKSRKSREEKFRSQEVISYVSTTHFDLMVLFYFDCPRNSWYMTTSKSRINLITSPRFIKIKSRKHPCKYSLQVRQSNDMFHRTGSFPPFESSLPGKIGKG